MNRRAARVFAAAAVSSGIGPNTVTVLSACSSFVGLVLLVVLPQSWGTGVLVASLLALGYIMDSADGQVARTTGKGSPAGEWLDHVVDAVRTPALHLAVFIGFERWFNFDPWLSYLPLVFALVAVGHFTSQILAEQLTRQRVAQLPVASPGVSSAEPHRKGALWSVLIIPADTGIMCWVFVLWGSPVLFAASYVLLFLFSLIFAGISARRKFVHLGVRVR
ncbi:CDP-alcohol phosphatidyltransferase family protein [Glutamicibacter sp. NPDC087344]|uniref:CDP-alcohol phosphatidyltransferase family protein n=1 Tax=Glutamicibacter sp. NPDC087344 TaxID=3363994 RepID=UPI00382B11D3